MNPRMHTRFMLWVPAEKDVLSRLVLQTELAKAMPWQIVTPGGDTGDRCPMCVEQCVGLHWHRSDCTFVDSMRENVERHVHGEGGCRRV